MAALASAAVVVPADQPRSDAVVVEKSVSFTLGEGMPIVPVKLVQRVTNGEFVEIWDLLPDNIELVAKLTVGGRVRQNVGVWEVQETRHY